MTNWISPKEAIMTPITIKETLRNTFKSGGAKPMPHVTRRTATGVVAFTNVLDPVTSPARRIAYLEHLNECYAQIQICHVPTNQAQAEKEANGDNGTQVNASCHLHLLATVQQGRSPRQDLSHDRGECQMPCCENDRLIRD